MLPLFAFLFTLAVAVVSFLASSHARKNGFKSKVAPGSNAELKPLPVEPPLSFPWRPRQTLDKLVSMGEQSIRNNTILGGVASDATVDRVNAIAGDRRISIPVPVVGGILGTSVASALGIGTILDELLGYRTRVIGLKFRRAIQDTEPKLLAKLKW
ncbi:hypothetical protein FB451DRAFT_1195246 [Mycena latifolia]|nr:hypothetical protein FB451DRAFT_1195246 [Mycena latifolia]